MIKKFFSLVLLSTFLFTTSGFSQNSDLSADPAQAKLEKMTAEAQRNKELLEIWKEHVRTLTQERDGAYHEIETLKTGMDAPQTGLGAARFGEIETQALPPAVMMPKNPSLPPAAISAALEKDVQGYQQTIRDLRQQIGDVQDQNQRMQKEIMEAGNDKTLIIKDKEEGVTKIESLSKQIRSLKDENERLNNVVRSANVPVQNAPVAETPKSSAGESLAFLQNAYNTQSVKLKKAQQEKEEIIRRADELQKKYVDLEAKAAPAAQAQNPFEINYVKSQNAKLKAELEKLRASAADTKPAASNSVDTEKITQVQNENQALKSELFGIKASQETLTRSFESLRLENRDLKAESSRLKGQSDAVQTRDESAKDSKIDSLKQILASISTEKSNLGNQNQTLTARVNALEKNLQDALTAREALKNENTDLKSQESKSAENSQSFAAQIAAIQASRDALAQKLQTSDQENIILKNNLSSAKSNALEQAKSDQDIYNAQVASLVSEKDLLARNLEDLKAKNRELELKMTAQRSDLESKIKSVEERNAGFDSEKAELNKQIEAFKAQIEELKLEAAKATQYQTEKKYLQNIYSEQSYKMKTQEISLAEMTKNLEALKIENQKLTSEAQSYQSSRLALQHDASNLEEKMKTLKAERAHDAKEIENLNLKSASLETEKEKVLAESQTMKQAMIDLEHEAQANEDKVSGLNDQINQLRDANASLEKSQAEQSKTIEALNASLKQSLDDIQNLKNNFQSYLESLVSSFEDRQKKSTAGSTPLPTQTADTN